MRDPRGDAAIWTSRQRDGTVDRERATSAGGGAGVVWTGSVGLEDEETVVGRKGSACDVGINSRRGWECVLQGDRQGSHVRVGGLKR